MIQKTYDKKVIVFNSRCSIGLGIKSKDKRLIETSFLRHGSIRDHVKRPMSDGKIIINFDSKSCCRISLNKGLDQKNII